jgi:hypothetical protein
MRQPAAGGRLPTMNLLQTPGCRHAIGRLQSVQPAVGEFGKIAKHAVRRRAATAIRRNLV